MVPPKRTLLVVIPAFEKQPTLEDLSSTLCTLEQRFCSMLARHTAQLDPPVVLFRGLFLVGG